MSEVEPSAHRPRHPCRFAGMHPLKLKDDALFIFAPKSAQTKLDIILGWMQSICNGEPPNPITGDDKLLLSVVARFPYSGEVRRAFKLEFQGKLNVCLLPEN